MPLGNVPKKNYTREQWSKTFQERTITATLRLQWLRTTITIKEVQNVRFSLNFFRGKLNPPYKTLQEHRNANEQERVADELMQKLIEQLTKEQKKLLLDFVNARDAVWYEDEEESLSWVFD